MTTFRISNATAWIDAEWKRVTVDVNEGRISGIYDADAAPATAELATTDIDASGKHLFPGLIDVHVHFREPGQTQKETIATGSASAARGGFTTVCTMPNLDPVPDSLENLNIQRDLIAEHATVHILPYGSITKGQQGEVLSDMEAMAPWVCGFSDDGFGVQNDALMEQALATAAGLNKVIAAHAEDDELAAGGVVNPSPYSESLGLPGKSPESEWRQVARDLDLLRQTGGHYHLCHASTKESLDLLRTAQAEGLSATAEAAPHYVGVNDGELDDDGRFRMNPPIRSAADQEAVQTALMDGTINIIATDHAPHTAEEKALGLAGSANGVVGLEVSFPVLYTTMVASGKMPLEALLAMFTTEPLERFGLAEVAEPRAGLPIGRGLVVGEPADLTIFDLDARYTVDPEEFLSKGRATPFAGVEVNGRCLLTVVGGAVAYCDAPLAEQVVHLPLSTPTGKAN